MNNSFFGRLLTIVLLSATGLAQNASRTTSRQLERKLQMTPRKERAAVLTRALTWLTGGAEENDYVSVGRLANYFGFVRFRITTGHAISRGAIGQEIYSLLDEQQRDRILRLLDEQWPALEACRLARVRINRQLEGLLVGESCELEDVERLGTWFGEAEARLGLALARGFAEVTQSLRPAQRDAFGAVRERSLAGDIARFRLARADKAKLRDHVGGGRDRRSQELWNLTSRRFTWVTGSPADNDYDTAGKPSQHFGFVDLRIDSGHGVTRGGLSSAIGALLTAEQSAPLAALVDQNRADFDAFFAARAAINRALERGLAGRPIDADAVQRFGGAQGLAEARMTWRQARAFLALRDSLTLDQADAFAALRGRFTLSAQSSDPSSSNRPPLEGDEIVLAGRRVFALCALCHAPANGRGVGPKLTGIIGRRIGGVDGYPYSPAMRARGGDGTVWTQQRLDAFLANPQRDTPGTIMGFTGIESRGQREAVIAYLQTLSETADEAAPGAASTRRAAPPAAPPPQQARSIAARPTQQATTSRKARDHKPNFVFVLFEGTGAGWASTSVAMDDRLPNAKAAAGLTPNLERIAREGMRFSDFYVSAPRCTPARASFLAGMSAGKLGMTYVNDGKGKRQKRGRREPIGPRKLLPPRSLTELPRAVTTLPELLREAGYATAHFGKWHVGRSAPSQHGFDQHDGANSNQGPDRNKKPNPQQAAMITDRGIQFARKESQAGRPFFIQLSHYGGGTADESRPETRQALAAQLRGLRGKTAWQTAILRDIDTDLGRLLDALEDSGLDEDTYVFISFDHGASGRNSNLPLAGGKGSLLEGGVRVPFLVRGPGVPAGSCCHARASSADLLPTLARLAEIKELPDAIEGASLQRALADPKATVERASKSLVIHFPHYDLQNRGPSSSIYRGDYKLIHRYEDEQDLLFDLRLDPGERDDLAASKREVVAELKRELLAHLRAIEAKLPTANPDYKK